MKLIKKNKEAVKRSVLKIVQICIMLNSQKYDFFFFSFLYFLLLFNYNCPTFFQLLFLSAPPPCHHTSPRVNPHPVAIPLGPLNMFLDLRLPLLCTIIPLPPPLWSLSVCYLFPCLWFYFAHLFVSLSSLHL